MLNFAIAIGRLTNVVKVKYQPSGVAFSKFQIASQKNFRNKNYEFETDYLDCITWGKQAEDITKYTTKGSLIAIQGRNQKRSYTNNSQQNIHVQEIVVENYQLLENKEVTEKRRSLLDQSKRPVQQHVEQTNKGEQTEAVQTDLTKNIMELMSQNPQYIAQVQQQQAIRQQQQELQNIDKQQQQDQEQENENKQLDESIERETYNADNEEQNVQLNESAEQETNSIEQEISDPFSEYRK